MSMNEIQFQLRPRRAKEEATETSTPRGRLPRIAEVLARAIGFDDMIRRGLAKDHSDLARLGCISKERISQVMRLLWPAHRCGLFAELQDCGAHGLFDFLRHAGH